MEICNSTVIAPEYNYKCFNDTQLKIITSTLLQVVFPESSAPHHGYLMCSPAAVVVSTQLSGACDC